MEVYMELKVGDIVEWEIIDFTHEGNGVLKIENFTVFASGGIEGAAEEGLARDDEAAAIW